MLTLALLVRANHIGIPSSTRANHVGIPYACVSTCSYLNQEVTAQRPSNAAAARLSLARACECSVRMFVCSGRLSETRRYYLLLFVFFVSALRRDVVYKV